MIAVQISGALIAWNVLLWLFFVAGQGFHVWLRASAIVNSKLNGVIGYGEWFKFKGPAVSARAFLATCLFLVFEYGSTTWFPSLAVGGVWPVKIAIAGVFGYTVDSIIDQVFTRLGFDKEIPPRVEDAPKP